MCFPIFTWIDVVNYGYFTTWPELPSKQIQKYCTKKEEISFGYIKTFNKIIHSTQPKLPRSKIWFWSILPWWGWYEEPCCLGPNQTVPNHILLKSHVYVCHVILYKQSFITINLVALSSHQSTRSNILYLTPCRSKHHTQFIHVQFAPNKIIIYKISNNSYIQWMTGAAPDLSSSNQYFPTSYWCLWR